MVKESGSRRVQTHERQGTQGRSDDAPGAPAPDPLLAKYDVRPLRGLPGPVERFHLAVVRDVLASADSCARSVGALRATQTWHRHHDGWAGSRPVELNFDGAAKRLACAPGCAHCCRSPVAVVAAEALLVAAAVERVLTASERLALRDRMAARKAALQGDPLGVSMCPLNVEGRCVVYEDRPYNCRIFHSFDVHACEGVFVGGAPQRGLPVDGVRKRFDQLIVASASVAFEALKLDTRTLELMSALEVALDAGPERQDRVAAGEDLFSGLPTISPPS